MKEINDADAKTAAEAVGDAAAAEAAAGTMTGVAGAGHRECHDELVDYTSTLAAVFSSELVDDTVTVSQDGRKCAPH